MCKNIPKNKSDLSHKLRELAVSYTLHKKIDSTGELKAEVINSYLELGVSLLMSSLFCIDGIHLSKDYVRDYIKTYLNEGFDHIFDDIYTKLNEIHSSNE